MKKEEIRKLGVHRLAIWLGNIIFVSIVILVLTVFGNVAQANTKNFGSILSMGQSMLGMGAVIVGLNYIAIIILTVIMLFKVKSALVVNRIYGIISISFLIVSLICWLVAAKLPLSMFGLMQGSLAFGIAGLSEIKFLLACLSIAFIHSIFQWIAGRTNIFEDKTNLIAEKPTQSSPQTVVTPQVIVEPRETIVSVEKAKVSQPSLKEMSTEKVKNETITTPIIETIQEGVSQLKTLKTKVAEKMIEVKVPTEVNVPTLGQTPLVELYQTINKSHLKNRVDSQYWLFKVDSKIIKQEDGINKRFCEVSFFNRKMNENENLMRLYINFNGEKITQDKFEIDKKYNNRNIMFFVIERDLAEVEYSIDIEAYIVDGNKIDIDERYINGIDVCDDLKKRNVIIEKYFKSNENSCLVVPHIDNDYWICTCGYYNDLGMETCPVCGMKKSLVKDMVNIQAEDLLEGINERIDVNSDMTIDSIINQYAESYYKNYGIHKQKVIDAIDKTQLENKQKVLIEQRIEQYLATKQITYKLKLSFKDNVVAYCEGITNAVITPQMVLSKLDLQQLQYDYDKAVVLQKNNQAMLKKYITIGGIVVSVVVVLYTAYSLLFKSEPQNNNTHEPVVEETVKDDSVFEVNIRDYTVRVGEATRINVSYVSSDIMFESENPLIASVSGDGYITGVASGTTIIDIYNNKTGRTDMVNVTVTSVVGTNTDYVIANSNTQLIQSADLDLLTKDQLRIARNEIYARHGCVFTDESLQSYFDSKSWYVKGTVTAANAFDLLSLMEKQNVEFIRNYEKEKGYN